MSHGLVADSLTPEVEDMVQLVWQEALGEIKDVLQTPLESLTLEQVGQEKKPFCENFRILEIL